MVPAAAPKGEHRTGRKKERLDKVLAAAGISSRKDARQMIRSGRVQVEGRVVTDPAAKVDPVVERVELDGRPVATGPLVLMLNKPAGVITASSDRSQPTVLDLLPPTVANRVFAAGRLDKDTEGLLILTSDGDLCHRLISPRHGVEKEYEVVVDGAIPPHLVEAFARGVRLDDGYVTLPARLEILFPGPGGRARVTVREGKYHQIRRMFAAFGLRVTALRRARIGSLSLDPHLAPGAYRALEPGEVDLLLINPAETPEQGPGGGPRPGSRDPGRAGSNTQ